MKTRQLPHQGAQRYLVYAGTGTDLIFNHGIDLPGFASFPLVDDPVARPVLAQQMRDLIHVAQNAGLGAILDTPTWVANKDRAASLGYDAEHLVRINRSAVALMRQVRDESMADDVLLALCLGPARDPYGDEDPLSVQAARIYHRAQIEAVRDMGIDLVNAYTFNQVQEGAGAVLAARDLDAPIALSLVVETDGALNDGTPVAEAIAEIDALTDRSAAYFMINCAHPDHFSAILRGNERLQGIVANASRCSHAELDGATSLDEGDPEELGTQVAALVKSNPMIRVFGGCCGTDMRHLTEMADNVKELT